MGPCVRRDDEESLDEMEAFRTARPLLLAYLERRLLAGWRGPTIFSVMAGQKREARLRARCPGHPRSCCGSQARTWMPGTRPGMTSGNGSIPDGARPLLLAHLERRLLAGRHGFLRHRQQHRDHHIVAGHSRQVHDLLIVEDFPRPRIGLVG